MRMRMRVGRCWRTYRSQPRDLLMRRSWLTCGRFVCHAPTPPRLARHALVLLRRTVRNPLPRRPLARHPVVTSTVARYPRLVSSYCLCSATRSETAVTATEVPCTGTATDAAAATVTEMPAATAAEVPASTAGVAPTAHSAAARMSAAAPASSRMSAASAAPTRTTSTTTAASTTTSG